MFGVIVLKHIHDRTKQKMSTSKMKLQTQSETIENGNLFEKKIWHGNGDEVI